MNGTLHGGSYFSFLGDNYDPEHMQFGTLRVFNDATLSPVLSGRSIRPVTLSRHPLCARELPTRRPGSIVKQGWVQHTTVGEGMWLSEIKL